MNYKFDSMSPMAVVLVRQTELWDNKLKLQKYSAIRQRIDMYCTLSHLDRAETEKYIMIPFSIAISTVLEISISFNRSLRNFINELGLITVSSGAISRKNLKDISYLERSTTSMSDKS